MLSAISEAQISRLSNAQFDVLIAGWVLSLPSDSVAEKLGLHRLAAKQFFDVCESKRDALLADILSH